MKKQKKLNQNLKDGLMAGRRRNTVQIKLNVSMDLSGLINDLSEALNLPKGRVLEELLLDKEKMKEYKEQKITALKKVP